MTSLKIQNESIEYPEWNLSVLFKMYWKFFLSYITVLWWLILSGY